MSTNVPYPERFISWFDRVQIGNNPWDYPSNVDGRNMIIPGVYPRRVGVLPYVGTLDISDDTGESIATPTAAKVAVINRLSVVVPDGISALAFDMFVGKGETGSSAYRLHTDIGDLDDLQYYAHAVTKISTQNVDGAAYWSADLGTPAADKAFKYDFFFPNPIILRASAGDQAVISAGEYTSATSTSTTLGAYTAGDSEHVTFAAVGWEMKETSFDNVWRDQQNWYTRMFRRRGDMLFKGSSTGTLTTSDPNLVDPDEGSAIFVDGFRVVADHEATPLDMSLTYGSASDTDFAGYDLDVIQKWLAIADRVWAWTAADTFWGIEVKWPPVLVNGDGGVYSSLGNTTAAHNVIGFVEESALSAGEGMISFTGWEVPTDELIEDL